MIQTCLAGGSQPHFTLGIPSIKLSLFNISTYMNNPFLNIKWINKSSVSFDHTSKLPSCLHFLLYPQCQFPFGSQQSPWDNYLLETFVREGWVKISTKAVYFNFFPYENKLLQAWKSYDLICIRCNLGENIERVLWISKNSEIKVLIHQSDIHHNA